MARSSGTIGASLKNAGWRRFQTRISTDPDSVLEGTGFELPVPRKTPGLWPISTCTTRRDGSCKNGVRIRQSLACAALRREWTRLRPVLSVSNPRGRAARERFELPVPRAMQARLEAKITGFGCIRRRLSAAAVGGHQLRRKAKSRNRTLIARGTGSFESISLQRRVRCELNLGEGGFADEIAAAPAGGFATLDTTICPGRKGPSGNQRPDGRRERGRWRSKRSYAGSGRTPPTRPLGIRGRPRRRDPGASASSLR